DTGVGIDNLEPLRRAAGNQKTAVIRAEIERRIEVVLGAAASGRTSGVSGCRFGSRLLDRFIERGSVLTRFFLATASSPPAAPARLPRPVLNRALFGGTACPFVIRFLLGSSAMVRGGGGLWQ
ncbi:MAG TPA: hypothetical protein DHK64_04660, partial [Rhodobiaceae bacterium]|nr:hypothetical protein [Rhodobiaceae bacterium]